MSGFSISAKRITLLNYNKTSRKSMYKEFESKVTNLGIPASKKISSDLKRPFEPFYI